MSGGEALLNILLGRSDEEPAQRQSLDVGPMLEVRTARGGEAWYKIPGIELDDAVDGAGRRRGERGIAINLDRFDEGNAIASPTGGCRRRGSSPATAFGEGRSGRDRAPNLTRGAPTGDRGSFPGHESSRGR